MASKKSYYIHLNFLFFLTDSKLTSIFKSFLLSSFHKMFFPISSNVLLSRSVLICLKSARISDLIRRPIKTGRNYLWLSSGVMSSQQSDLSGNPGDIKVFVETLECSYHSGCITVMEPYELFLWTQLARYFQSQACVAGLSVGPVSKWLCYRNFKLLS